MAEQLDHDVADYLNHALWHFGNTAGDWDSDERALERWARELKERLDRRLYYAGFSVTDAPADGENVTNDPTHPAADALQATLDDERRQNNETD